MRRIASALTVLAVASGLTGCAASRTVTTASSASASGQASAAPSPSPTPTLSIDQLTAWVDGAGLSKSAVGAAGLTQDKGKVAIPVPCGEQAQDEDDLAYGHDWRFGGGALRYLEEYVVGYAHFRGTDVIAEMERIANSCQTYNQNDGAGTYTVEMVGDYAINAPAGTNAAYGYCELSTVVTPAAYKGHKTMFCTALVAKGQVVMRLRVYGDQPTEASGHQKLDAVVALAVPPFVAAAPTT